MNRMIKASLLGSLLLAAACGPSPEEVCDKSLALATAAVGAQSAAATLGFREQCVKSETRRKEMIGAMKYKKRNACLMEAKQWSDALACK